MPVGQSENYTENYTEKGQNQNISSGGSGEGRERKGIAFIRGCSSPVFCAIVLVISAHPSPEIL